MAFKMRDPYHTNGKEKELPSSQYEQDLKEQDARARKRRGSVLEFVIELAGEVVEAIIDAVT